MIKPLILRVGYLVVPDRNTWLRKQFEKSGSSYIKIGQFISSRSDVFGKELSDEMSKLQDSVEPVKWGDLEKYVDMSNFTDVDTDPLASASVAQIHRARYKNKDVVLKIKKPNVEKSLKADISSIKACLNAFPFLESNKALPWIEEIDRTIDKELDFRNEILNLKKFREMYRWDEDVIIPKVYPSVSSENVIVMEYVPSDKSIFNSERLIDMFVEQILFEGVIHGDLHGGNIGFSGKNLVMYDFGNIIYISPKYQQAMREFIMALQMKDVDKTIDAMSKMGMNVRSIDGTRIFIKKFFNYIETLDIKSFKFSADEIIDKVPVEVDSTTFTILRSFSLLEGLCKKRDPNFKYEDIFLKNLELLMLSQLFSSSESST